MISWFSRHQKPLFIATVSIFLVGTFVGLGGYLLTNHDSSGAVASVGSTKISYSILKARPLFSMTAFLISSFIFTRCVPFIMTHPRPMKKCAAARFFPLFLDR